MRGPERVRRLVGGAGALRGLRGVGDAGVPADPGGVRQVGRAGRPAPGPATGVDFHLLVTALSAAQVESERARSAVPEPGGVNRPPRRHLPGADGMHWLAGDLHAHTVHSDGALTVAQLAALAASRGLDFLAVTDHNTTSHGELAGAGRRHGIQLLPGQEVTTDTGHANAFGDIGFVDFREPATVWQRSVAARGGLLSVNHPLAADCCWRMDLAGPTPSRRSGTPPGSCAPGAARSRGGVPGDWGRPRSAAATSTARVPMRCPASRPRGCCAPTTTSSPVWLRAVPPSVPGRPARSAALRRRARGAGRGGRPAQRLRPAPAGRARRRLPRTCRWWPRLARGPPHAGPGRLRLTRPVSGAPAPWRSPTARGRGGPRHRRPRRGHRADRTGRSASPPGAAHRAGRARPVPARCTRDEAHLEPVPPAPHRRHHHARTVELQCRGGRMRLERPFRGRGRRGRPVPCRQRPRGGGTAPWPRGGGVLPVTGVGQHGELGRCGAKALGRRGGQLGACGLLTVRMDVAAEVADGAQQREGQGLPPRDVDDLVLHGPLEQHSGAAGIDEPLSRVGRERELATRPALGRERASNDGQLTLGVNRGGGPAERHQQAQPVVGGAVLPCEGQPHEGLVRTQLDPHGHADRLRAGRPGPSASSRVGSR